MFLWGGEGREGGGKGVQTDYLDLSFSFIHRIVEKLITHPNFLEHFCDTRLHISSCVWLFSKRFYFTCGPFELSVHLVATVLCLGLEYLF